VEKVSPANPSPCHILVTAAVVVVTFPAGSPVPVTLTDTRTSQPVTSILVVERLARLETGLLLGS